MEVPRRRPGLRRGSRRSGRGLRGRHRRRRGGRGGTGRGHRRRSAGHDGVVGFALALGIGVGRRTPAARPVGGGPLPRRPEDEAQPTKAAARPRTAKKKVTLPKAVKRTLAENESWRDARLFPASALKSDRERETRATSVLLSVMAQVPEFGRRLTAAFGAPAGRMETFTEVTLPHGDTPVAPTE